MLEEWTTVAKRLFRLDLIDSYSGTRRTLLSNKYTNENFYYKPFECSLVSNFDTAYFPDLADKFRSNFDLLVPTGVGSLWLQSSDVDASYLVSSYDDSSKVTVKTSSRVLRNYIQYKVPISGNGYPYRLDFFFRPGGESLESLALVHILKPASDGKPAKVIMRIKILEIETFKESIDLLSDFEGLFDLPVGYGCQRGEFYDRSFAVPVNRFMPNFVPHVLQLDIVSTQPIDSSHDTDKWKNHEVSVRIVTGRLKSDNLLSNDYIILETQDFALKSQSASTISIDGIKEAATLRRRKRVWDLGVNGLTSKDSEKRAKFFEIDERTRQCLNFGENKLSESASIEFGISSKENRNASSSSSSNNDTQAKMILTLNTELIDTLFTSTQDYHLIRENRPQTYPHKRETVYERRVNKFQFKDSNGDVVWSGPVSFIRKHSTRSSDVMHQTSSTMYFYSNDLTKLVGKVHMFVIERRTISEAYLHREIEDIGKICFSKMLSSETDEKLNWLYKETSDYDGSLDFVLSYPIESKDMAEKLSMINSIDEILYKEFIVTMFAASKDRLNFLQLSDIDIDFGPEMIKISAQISEMPSLLNYWQDYGQKFSESKTNLLFSEKNIFNDELCAKSCLYYNCFMFSYCSNTKTCDILMTKVENFSNNPKRGGIVMTFEPDSSCSVFRPRTNLDNLNNIKSFIKPNELIQNLQQTILSSKGEDENNVLKLELLHISTKQEEVKINLTPLFITSGNFSSEDLENLFGEENGKKALDNNQVKAEYKIVFENRKFKDTLKVSQDFPLQLAQHTSYNDCKLLCSEIDCRSFSHCKIESTCRVSMLHKTKLIIDSSEEEDLCVISSRDYSSKFKQTLNDKHISKLRNVSKTLIAGSENDCAIDCMEEEKFKCKSFYYCPRQQQGKETEEEGEEGDEFNCYLRKTHLAVENKLPAINKTISQAKQRKCYLYTRK